MCRWLAYMGAPIPIEDVLFKPRNSLIDQSLSAKSAETPTNGDGFGLGWYGTRETPGVFRSIRPAWNDFNLRDLAAQMDSHLFLAHVRATSHATVQETNCHPFRYKEWLFVHNGEVFGIEKFRKRLLTAIADEFFPNIYGTTDSEVMFHLALTFGLERDPEGAIARMAGFVEDVAREHGVDEALWMTLGITNGEGFCAVRYASDRQAPSLHYTRDVEDVHRLAPELRGRFSADTRLIASEPTGKTENMWLTVPESTFLRVGVGSEEIELKPFKPKRG